MAYGGLLAGPPVEAHAAFSLSIVSDYRPWEMFGHVVGPPGYRPLAYFTIALQREIWGYSLIPFYLANAGFLFCFSAAVYAVVTACCNNRNVALLCAALCALDPRWISDVLWLTGRQATLAGLFAAVSCWLCLRLHQGSESLRTSVLAALFSLAAALCKEYGLATLALPFWLMCATTRHRERRLHLAHITIVIIAYGLLRFGLAGADQIGGGDYCSTMGYGTSVRQFCVEQQTAITLGLQMAWNVLATFIGIWLPSLIGGAGELLNPLDDLGLLTLMTVGEVAILIAAVAAYRQDRALSVGFLGIVVATALVSFVLYRPRNHTVAAVAIYALIGMGLTALMDRFRHFRYRVAAVWLMGAALFALVFARGLQIEMTMARVQIPPPAEQLCALAERPHVDLDVFRSVIAQYGVEDLDCPPTSQK